MKATTMIHGLCQPEGASFTMIASELMSFLCRSRAEKVELLPCTVQSG